MQSSAHSNTSDSQNVIPCLKLIQSELKQVRKIINQQLIFSSKGKKSPKGISTLLESVRSRSGKMIRPGLVLLSNRAVSGNLSGKNVLQVAACIEIVHHATLLHDDVIDEGMQRRGKPTINNLWGNESAVLLGDFLLSHVFKLSSELEPEVINVIARAAVRLCEGELKQIVQKDNWLMSESEYIDVITEKSAALFSYSCYLGAVLSRANKRQAKILSDYGLNAGIAFQITDDLLDITGDEKRTGKTTGSDAEKHKPTLAVIHLLKTVDQKTRTKLIKTYLNGNYKQESFIEMLKKSGSLEYAQKQAQKYVAKAINTLKKLPQSEAKNALIETAKFMTNRTS